MRQTGNYTSREYKGAIRAKGNDSDEVEGGKGGEVEEMVGVRGGGGVISKGALCHNAAFEHFYYWMWSGGGAAPSWPRQQNVVKWWQLISRCS